MQILRKDGLLVNIALVTGELHLLQVRLHITEAISLHRMLCSHHNHLANWKFRAIADCQRQRFSGGKLIQQGHRLRGRCVGKCKAGKRLETSTPPHDEIDDVRSVMHERIVNPHTGRQVRITEITDLLNLAQQARAQSSMDAHIRLEIARCMRTPCNYMLLLGNPSYLFGFPYVSTWRQLY